MSEAERKKRQVYKENRKKWIMIQIIAILLISVIAIGAFAVYNRMNREYYIQYTEKGNATYDVYLRENGFFEDESVGADQAYVAALIKNIKASFAYDLLMDAEEVSFDYAYSVSANMVITDKSSGKPLYSTSDALVEKTEGAIESDNRVMIREDVEIDFTKYNTLATSFINIYGTKNTSATLMVTLDVSVLSRCDEFASSEDNSYFVALNIPLTANTVDIQTSSSVAEDESKVLACKDAGSLDALKIVGIVFAALAVLLVGALIFFVYATRNEDINYMIKVKRLVNAYRSFIQQMDGAFDVDGYQVLQIKTFNEMLGIRDTIQSPILMCENADQTKTQFFIPTATNLLYLYEIKVDNYDAIYAKVEFDSDSAVEIELEMEEEPVVLEEVNAEELAEAMAQPDVELAEIEYSPDDDDQFVPETEDKGVEVIGVVWPERAHRNKVYRYDPNGETLEQGDIVLAPTYDAAKGRDVIRKVAVAHENHMVDVEHIKHPLKKIVAVVRKTLTRSLDAEADESEK